MAHSLCNASQVLLCSIQTKTRVPHMNYKFLCITPQVEPNASLFHSNENMGATHEFRQTNSCATLHKSSTLFHSNENTGATHQLQMNKQKNFYTMRYMLNQALLYSIQIKTWVSHMTYKQKFIQILFLQKSETRMTASVLKWDVFIRRKWAERTCSFK